MGLEGFFSAARGSAAALVVNFLQLVPMLAVGGVEMRQTEVGDPARGLSLFSSSFWRQARRDGWQLLCLWDQLG